MIDCVFFQCHQYYYSAIIWIFLSPNPDERYFKHLSFKKSEAEDEFLIFASNNWILQITNLS